MKRTIKFFLGILVFLNIIAWTALFHLSQPGILKVVFFDVGQGDSVFIETPDRYQVLIDGGPDLTILEKLAAQMPFYDRTLDLLILSHPEKDHLFGLLEVLKRYKIKNILWTAVVRETAEWKEWESLIKEEEAGIKIAQADQKINIGRPGLPIFLEILHPFENISGQEFENSNDTSIVASLVFGDVSFLFTGDITKKVEKKLVERGINLEVEVLKIAHHGSKTSNSQEFLERVLPEIAVIQVGENNYGHPHPEVLARLQQFGIEVLITREAGDIKIISDGNNFKIK